MKQTHPIIATIVTYIYSYIVVKSKNLPFSCLLKRLPYKFLPFIAIVIIIVITMKLYNIASYCYYYCYNNETIQRVFSSFKAALMVAS